jgi:crotonobetainyl-CoA:carnitine CoA-transferase CaiB-like acyl-CoA transferase
MAGKDAAIAILGALLQRERSSEVLPVETRLLHISLKQSATAALINVAQNTLVSGNDARRWGNGHPNLVPYQLFATADARMVLAVGNDAQWKAACRALQLEELGADVALDTNSGRLAQRDRVVTTIANRLAENVASYWLGALQQVGVPCGIVKSVKEALASVPASASTGVSPAIPGTVRRRPPRLDEHGEAVRKGGWSVFQAS